MKLSSLTTFLLRCERRSSKKQKEGSFKKIRLDDLYGREVYRVKSYYGDSTKIEISLVIARSGRVVERKVSQGLLNFFTTSVVRGRTGKLEECSDSRVSVDSEQEIAHIPFTVYSLTCFVRGTILGVL